MWSQRSHFVASRIQGSIRRNMKYRKRSVGGYTEFTVKRDLLEVTVNQYFSSRQEHRFPRSVFSSSTGWVEERDKVISSIIQICFLVIFIVTVVGHVMQESTSFWLWGGISVSIIGMVLGHLLSPKRHCFILYSQSGQVMIGIQEKMGREGGEAFKDFVQEIESWLGSPDVE